MSPCFLSRLIQDLLAGASKAPFSQESPFLNQIIIIFSIPQPDNFIYVRPAISFDVFVLMSPTHAFIDINIYKDINKYTKCRIGVM